MVRLISSILLATIFENGASFAPKSSIGGFPSTESSFLGKAQASAWTRLNVGAGIDPDELMGQECIITPEGFGFSSSVDRILKSSGRNGGYYRARASDIVTDVMEGITNGGADVALVFDDETDKLSGIFTETDYIKVSVVGRKSWIVKYGVVVLFSTCSTFSCCSFLCKEVKLPRLKKSQQNISYLQ